MRYMNRHCGLALGTLLILLVGLGTGLCAEDKKDADDFKPIFNGKDFTGWKFHMEARKADQVGKTWSIKDEMIICQGHPAGFVYTDKSFKNYVMRYDWRYPRPAGLTDDSKFNGNSGALMHIHNPEKGVIGVWPNCVEVQGMNTRHGELLFIPRDQGKGK